MYFFARALWPSNHNSFRHIFIGLILTALLSVGYRYVSEKNARFKNFVTKTSLSFLGFAVSIIAVLILVIAVKLLIEALAK